MKLSNEYKNYLSEFDGVSDAIIGPEAFIDFSRVQNFPQIVVFSFTKSIVEKFAKLDGVRIADYLDSSMGSYPIYAINYKGVDIGFMQAFIGAPLLTMEVEEIIARGAEKIVVFGSCGALDNSIVDGHIVIPAEAIRDEGTSYHYAPPSDSIFMDDNSVKVLEEVMKDFGYKYIVGKTWTTDALYRETKDKAARRKDEGCCVVEMECSALIAMTSFRKVKFAQFVYAADNLDAENWEQRGLTADQGLEKSDIYMQAAFETGLRL